MRHLFTSQPENDVINVNLYHEYVAILFLNKERLINTPLIEVMVQKELS